MPTRPPVLKRRHEITTAALLLFVMVVAVQPQFALGTLAPLILEELDGSHVAYGSLISIMFLVASGASPLAGRVTDRLGARTVLLMFFVTAAVALVLIAVAPSMLVLMLAAAVGGLGLSWCNPVTNSLLVTHIFEPRRGVVLGVKQSGVTLGIAVSGVSLPALAAVLGWRGAAAAAAVLVLGVGLAGTALIIERQTATASNRPISSVYARPGGWLVAYAFFMGAGISATTAYLVLYAHEDLGLSLRTAGVLVACHGGMGVLSRVVMGALAPRVDDLESLLALLALGAIAAAGLILVGGPGTTAVVWIGAFVMGWTGSSWNVIAQYLVLREAGERRNGAATGYLQRGFYAGFCFCPLAFGAIVELTGRYALAWALVAAAFAAGAAVVVGRRLTRPAKAAAKQG